jgi:hypothetical protein
MIKRLFAFLQLTALALLFSSPINAQPLLFKGDNGCKPTCQRSDGMSCSPCHITGVGPGDPAWDRQIGEARIANERFVQDVTERARADEAYRRSEQYKIDRDVARDMKRDLTIMGKIPHL